MKLTKEDVKKIEDLGWTVQKNQTGNIVIANYSPSGEDMTTEVSSKEELISVCEDFDPDEHFDLWYGANRGEPSSPSELIRDCDDQLEMYEALAEALR